MVWFADDLSLVDSEIISREIDPVLFILLLTTDNFSQTEHWGIVSYLTLVNLVFGLSSRTDSAPPVTPFPTIGFGGGA